MNFHAFFSNRTNFIENGAFLTVQKIHFVNQFIKLIKTKQKMKKITQNPLRA